MKSLGIEKSKAYRRNRLASASDGHYGAQGSNACDEYKEGLYYQLTMEWDP